MERRITFLACIMAMYFSTEAHATPVYLECNTFNKYSSTTTNYKITLDESSQTATFSDDSLTAGNSYTIPAQFSRTEVKFNWNIQNLNFTNYYKIDRVTMDFSESFEKNPEKTDFGKCKIAQPVKRQF